MVTFIYNKKQYINMRKLLFSLIMFLLLATNLYSQPPTIYDYAEQIQQNPRLYIIVLGKDATNEEINAASEISSVLNVRKIYRENQITTLNKNLIIIGTPQTNSRIQNQISLISTYGANLIISGSPSQITKAASLLKNHEANIEKLLTNELKLKIELFSPLKNIYIVFIVSTIALIVVLFAMLKNFKKQSTGHPKLLKYAEKAMQRGYSKYEIRQILLKSSWPKSIIDAEFKKLP
jgi:hypothetical protein